LEDFQLGLEENEDPKRLLKETKVAKRNRVQKSISKKAEKNQI